MSHSEIEAELREIAKYRKTDRIGYSKNEQIQARERELLEMQSPGYGLDPDLLESWSKTGGVLFNFTRAQGNAEAMMAEMDDAKEFQDSFDELPTAVQSAVFAELVLEPDTRVKPASQQEIKTFASTPEGADLVDLWSDKAALKVGVVRTRLDRMLMSAKDVDDIDAAVDWFNGLSSADAKTVLKRLAG